MERSAGGSTFEGTTERRPRAIAKSDPRSRRVNRSSRAAEFAAFADGARRDLNPRGPLEAVMADHVIRAAWRLRTTLDRDLALDFGPEADPDRTPADAPRKRASAPAADRAARSVKEAVESLDTLRLVLNLRAKAPEPAPSALAPMPEAPTDPEVEIEPNEWPIFPRAGDEIEPVPAEESPHWRDRLVFDFEVSDASPIIKGTWITVGHVISLIVDGETWADILRSHPELTEPDIRACLAYTIAEDDPTAT